MAEDNPIFNIEDDLFSFETDHLALKGNKDYCEVLKTLVILTAQREKALKDYKKVSELKNEALRDPFETLNKIRNGSDLGVPLLHELPKLPVIDLKKYNVNISQTDLKEIYVDPLIKEEEILSDVKPSIVNHRAWSPEEQKRLEELLQFYPPEPIEQRRFQKIAIALDFNVPVHMDTLNDIPGPSSSSLHSNSCSSLTSTASAGSPSQPSTSSNYLLQTEYHEHIEMPSMTVEKDQKEIQLDLLKRIRREKANDHGGNFSHFGFKCDYCEDEPIIGTRWHCATCKESIDFCTDCVLSQMYADNCHPLTHWLVVYRGETPDLESSRLYSSSTTTNQVKNDQQNPPNIRKSFEESYTELYKEKYGETSGLGCTKNARDDDNRILTKDELSNLDQLLDECDNSNSDSEMMSD